jgi:formiminotetrahydrofolate cyclodeaminase
MDIKSSSVQAFLDDLASSSATPGGGAAAALAGAASAALIGMVCNLTVGRPRFAAVEDDLRAALAQAESLREQLAALAEADTGAFNQVMAAYRLPKDGDEQQSARQAAIQAALKQATRVPLETAIACAAALRLAGRIIAQINPNALSDAGTAAVLAEAGLRGAQFNVAVNLAGIQDAEFVQAARQALAQALEGADEERKRVLAYVLGA